MDAAQLWALGDYAQVAQRLQPAAEVLVDAAGVTAGQRVLDVAAGTGNTADAALRRGATVVASDITPAMLDLGRRRLPDIEWHEADAQDLPFADASFDRTLSTFGAIFAPDPRRVACELLRVTRPDGIAALTSWVDDPLQEAAMAAIREAMPGAPAPPTAQWSRPDLIEQHFAGTPVTVEQHTLRWTFQDPRAWVDYMATSVPPVVAARRAIGDQRWPAVAAQMLEIVGGHGDMVAGGFVVEPAYLVVLARRA